MYRRTSFTATDAAYAEPAVQTTSFTARNAVPKPSFLVPNGLILKLLNPLLLLLTSLHRCTEPVYTTGCCYSFVLKDSHRCVDRAMHQNCPICFEYMFESARDINVLRCGHMIHVECLREMRAHRRFSCPVCLKSACDMSDAWQKLDRQVAASPMPAIQKKMIWILCNDCGAASEVQFHILAHKCPGCSSYNTRQTG